MVKLVFLGRLEDVAGMAELMVPAGTIASVLAALEPQLAAALSEPRIKVALNGALLRDTVGTVLQEGDELAFLPPVSGG